MTEPERAFVKRWDAHMLHEPVKANRFLGDALLRFTEANKKWLAERDVAVVFFRHLSDLILTGAAPRDVVEDCIRRVRLVKDASNDSIS